MDYEKYRLNIIEILEGVGFYSLICAVIAATFYRSVIAFLVLLPGLVVGIKPYKNYLIKKRKGRLTDEFSECLYSVSSSVKAGYSIENAFLEARKDMEMFYGKKSLMAQEIDIIRNGFRMKKNLEELIADMGKRSNLEEINLFADVLKCAKRNGGNITEVLTETADRIRERICVDNEIKVYSAEKKLELRIMEAVPFFILIYLQVTSRGYFDILYESIRGRIFMTICLLVYLAAVVVSEKIMRVKF